MITKLRKGKKISNSTVSVRFVYGLKTKKGHAIEISKVISKKRHMKNKSLMVRPQKGAVFP